MATKLPITLETMIKAAQKEQDEVLAAKLKARNNYMFNIIKRYYERGLYTKANVATFVRSGQIDKDDYYLITGEDFV